MFTAVNPWRQPMLGPRFTAVNSTHRSQGIVSHGQEGQVSDGKTAWNRGRGVLRRDRDQHDLHGCGMAKGQGGTMFRSLETALPDRQPKSSTKYCNINRMSAWLCSRDGASRLKSHCQASSAQGAGPQH